MPPKVAGAVKGRPKGTSRGDASSEVRAMKWDQEADRELFIAILASMPVKPDLDLVAANMRCSPRAVSERMDSLRKEARRSADPGAPARADASRQARNGPLITQYEPRQAQETGLAAGSKRNMAPSHSSSPPPPPSKRQKAAVVSAGADPSEMEGIEDDAGLAGLEAAQWASKRG